MAAIADAPHIKILEAVKATLEAVDFLDLAGMTGVKALTIRHFRQRYSTSGERPCLAIKWTGRPDNNVDDQYKNSDERPLKCGIDLVIDLLPVPEDAADDPDPTGWAEMSRIAAVALEALRDEDPANPLSLVCDGWVIDEDLVPDEDSKPDNGRLVQAISVVYRVRTFDSNVLLAKGAN